MAQPNKLTGQRIGVPLDLAANGIIRVRISSLCAGNQEVAPLQPNLPADPGDSSPVFSRFGSTYTQGTLEKTL